MKTLITIALVVVLWHAWVHLDDASRQRQTIVNSWSQDEDSPAFFTTKGLGSQILEIHFTENAGRDVDDHAGCDSWADSVIHTRKDLVTSLRQQGFTAITCGDTTRRLL